MLYLGWHYNIRLVCLHRFIGSTDLSCSFRYLKLSLLVFIMYLLFAYVDHTAGTALLVRQYFMEPEHWASACNKDHITW